MSVDPARPGLDAWIGVGHAVLRYIQALEVLVAELRVRLRIVDLEYEHELSKRERLLTEKDAQIARLEQQNRLLQESKRLTSRNSSKPPSSDSPSAPKRVPKTATGKRRGGQPGHPKHARPLVPVEACAAVTDHLPETCAKCQAPLSGRDPAPLRHQTVELPVVEPIVIEHRLHTLVCACGHRTHAVLPADANPTGFGPRLEATVATLACACRLSHRAIVAVMADLFRVRLGLGTVTKILRRTSRAVEQPVDEAREAVREGADPKHVDETGWFQRGADGTNEDKKRAWLWVAATAAAVVFHVALSRSRAVAREVIGSVTLGVLVTDRYPAYAYVDVHARQLCWAHLKRDFVRIGERSGASTRIGKGLVKIADEVFAATHKHRAGTMKTEVWRAKMERLRQQTRDLLEQGARFDIRPHESSERSRTKRTCEDLLKVEPAMWTFVREPDVDLTNNAAERALRHAVLWRRASFGSQSADGAEMVARLLTVVMTKRARGESPYEYLVEACRAAREGRDPPSLVG